MRKNIKLRITELGQRNNFDKKNIKWCKMENRIRPKRWNRQKRMK